MSSQFSQFNLSSSMIDALSSLGYEQMTQIQFKSLPFILKNRDVIAQAKTGSGKTALFGIGVLNKLNVKRFRIQALIMCPTRELANQVASELRKIARFSHNIKILTLCGGVSYNTQMHSLSHQAHIVIGTPGRVLKHFQNDNIEYGYIETLVLDEADRMLDMGFSEDIENIISYIPKKRQTLLFSATFPENINTLSKNILINPETIEVKSTHEKSVIIQEFYEVENYNKLDIVQRIINNEEAKCIVIFCNTKIACDKLADDLYDIKILSLVLHSDLDQRERNETLIMFANKSYPILIATDVAARGIDIKDIDLVINYDLPFDNEVYIHRIGRTGRAGAKGKAVSLIANEEQLCELEKYLDDKIIKRYIDNLPDNKIFNIQSEFSTLFINGGKKNKIRAGDILGALTAGIGIHKDDIGKIDILDLCSFVGVKKSIKQKALDGLSNGRIKGKYFKVFPK
ncbi:ATP-dependent 23S rRNA helicase DbpA [hydrothermal vent metagenome]|uniref:ATP-dependent 23S rRNA helicase DbpA n=1 Tax=hydrothermal vent metagenome TaxID=652676 RepID=A0A3B1DR20_9ZZZZ